MIMKKLSAILALVLMLCLCVTALAADDLDASKKVSKADVGQLPTKTA